MNRSLLAALSEAVLAILAWLLSGGCSGVAGRWTACLPGAGGREEEGRLARAQRCAPSGRNDFARDQGPP